MDFRISLRFLESYGINKKMLTGKGPMGYHKQ